MTKRRAYIIIAIAVVVIAWLVVVKLIGPAFEVSEGEVSNNLSIQLPRGSIAYQNMWNASDFFMEAKALKLCNLIANNDSARIEELIINEAVDLNCIGRAGMSPLLWAYACGREDIVMRLLSSGADPDIKLQQSLPIKQRTPLLEGDTLAFTMLRQMDLEIFNDCLRFIRDQNQRDKQGDTLLHKLIGQIAQNSSPGERLFQLAERLISIGVDVNAKNSHSGYTPLHVAFVSLPEIGPLLLEHGADPTITSNDGISVLGMLAKIELYLPTNSLRRDEAILRYSHLVDRLKVYRDERK